MHGGLDGRIYVAGHRGLVGNAIVRALRRAGAAPILTAGRDELDLRDRAAVDRFFAREAPDLVFLAAATVGGILANAQRPAEFLFDNLAIATNVIDSAWRHGVRKLLFLGSSCIYPRHAPQPMTEACLLTGPLEPTNEAYAIAKIAGLKLCAAYRQQYGFDAVALMPTNVYGPGDNFDLESGHVVAALIRKAHEAALRDDRQLVVWGTGNPRREFLHVDDLADACLFAMANHSDEVALNVGVGADVSIRELAETVCDVAGFRGNLIFDTTKPDGAPQKLLDVSRMTRLGWRARIGLRDGLAETYRWYVARAAVGSA